MPSSGLLQGLLKRDGKKLCGWKCIGTWLLGGASVRVSGVINQSYLKGLRGMEVLFSLCAVTTSRVLLTDTIERLAEASSRPSDSIFTLRDEKNWQSAIKKARAALSGGGELDRWGAAAFIEALLQSGPAIDLLSVNAHFWGKALERFAFGGTLAAQLAHWNLSEGWRLDHWGVRLVEPFFVAPLTAAESSDLAVDPSSISEGDEYSRQVQKAWLTELSNSLQMIPASPNGSEIVIVPRIASAVVAGRLYEDIDVSENANNAFAVLSALEFDPLAASPGQIDNSTIAVLIHHLRRRFAADAAMSAKLEEAIARRFAASLEDGESDENARRLLQEDVLRHYDDAFEELVYLALPE